MHTIYGYKGLYGKSDIIEKINEISEQIEAEQAKSNSEYNSEKERQLIYAQFIQGLKLSTR